MPDLQKTSVTCSNGYGRIVVISVSARERSRCGKPPHQAIGLCPDRDKHSFDYENGARAGDMPSNLPIGESIEKKVLLMWRLCVR